MSTYYKIVLVVLRTLAIIYFIYNIPKTMILLTTVTVTAIGLFSILAMLVSWFVLPYFVYKAAPQLARLATKEIEN